MKPKDTTLPKLALFLKTRCQTVGLTPKELASLSGLSIRIIYNLLNGTTKYIVDSNLEPLSIHLHCTIEELYSHSPRNYLLQERTPLQSLLFSLRVKNNLSLTMLSEILGVSTETIKANEDLSSSLLNPTTALIFSNVFCVDKKIFIPFLNTYSKPTKSLFGQKMRFYRACQLLSLSRLSQLLHVSKQLLSQYEQGAYTPSTTILTSLSTILKVSTSELLIAIQDDKKIIKKV